MTLAGSHFPVEVQVVKTTRARSALVAQGSKPFVASVHLHVREADSGDPDGRGWMQDVEFVAKSSARRCPTDAVYVSPKK
jgi:hypothetical protein